MDRIKALLLFCFLFTAAFVFGVPFDMILTGDSVLDDLRFLSLETGRPFLSMTPPLAPEEVRNFLNSIDESALSPAALETYYRALDRLIREPPPLSLSDERFSLFLNVDATLVGRMRFNSDVSWYPHYPEITPFLSFPVNYYISEYVQLFVELSIAVRPGEYGLGNFDINIPSDYYTYNESMPLRAFLALGGDWWNFQIGRDRLYWGTAFSGSLVFSDNSQYIDYARLSFFSSTTKYSFIVSHLPLTLYEHLFPQTDPVSEVDWNAPDIFTRSMHRYYYLHRFDITFFDKVSFSFMEGVLVGNSPLELQYLNPMVVFHSFFSWEYYDEWKAGIFSGTMNGSFLSIEINWNVISSLSIYGQLAMNQFASPDELSQNPAPNGIGYLAGAQYSHSFNNWGALFYFEFTYTDPYFYLSESPFGSFIQVDRFKQYYYIGYPRDTIAVTLGALFFNNNQYKVSGNFSWISNGEHDKNGLTWDWQRTSEAFAESTPYGKAENKFILSLAGEWQPYSWLVLKTEITGILSFNNNHSGRTETGGQVIVSASFKY